MNTYVALLRGINVGGHKLIKMAELKVHLASIGLKEVQTYIQSGNIVFQYENVPFQVLEDKIHDKIKSEYGFEVPIVIISREMLHMVIQNNPLLRESEEAPKHMHVIFLSAIPEKDKVDLIRHVEFPGETWILKDNYVYLYNPNGVAKAKLGNTYFEKKLGVKATARNWNTVKILAEMPG